MVTDAHMITYFVVLRQWKHLLSIKCETPSYT